MQSRGYEKLWGGAFGQSAGQPFDESVSSHFVRQILMLLDTMSRESSSVRLVVLRVGWHGGASELDRLSGMFGRTYTNGVTACLQLRTR
jgi:hypothetical protein